MVFIHFIHVHEKNQAYKEKNLKLEHMVISAYHFMWIAYFHHKCGVISHWILLVSSSKTSKVVGWCYKQ